MDIVEAVLALVAVVAAAGAFRCANALVLTYQIRGTMDRLRTRDGMALTNKVWRWDDTAGKYTMTDWTIGAVRAIAKGLVFSLAIAVGATAWLATLV